MARKQGFLAADFSKQCDETYAAMQHQQQSGADKYYNEARINDGDRLVHRIERGTVYFVDIVSHDLIAKYCRQR